MAAHVHRIANALAYTINTENITCFHAFSFTHIQ